MPIVAECSMRLDVCTTLTHNYEWLQIGSFTVATCAKAANKEVYVLAESFKFVRLYPLNQKDLPEEFKVSISLCNL